MLQEEFPIAPYIVAVILFLIVFVIAICLCKSKLVGALIGIIL